MLLSVAANRENDTFWSGLVMGVADCIIYAGLNKIPLKSFTRQIQLLSSCFLCKVCAI